MIEALRPSTLGEILDRTAHLYRSRFMVFFGIAVLPTGVVLACAASVFLYFAWLGIGAGNAMGPTAVGVLTLLLLALGGLVLLPLCTVAMALGWAASTHAASQVLLGESVTVSGAYSTAWKRRWHYLWLLVLEMLIVAVAPMVAWVFIVGIMAAMAAVSQASGGGNASTALGAAMLLLLALLGSYSVWMLLRLSLAFPACAVEDLGAWTALKRAVSLSKGRRGRIFLLFLLGTVLGWMLSMLLTIPVVVVISLIPGSSTPQHAQMAGTVFLFTLYAAGFAVQALTRPVYAIALVAFYYDGRVRHEGFDIEWMMRQAGMIEAPASPAAAKPWIAAIEDRGRSVPKAEDAGAGGSGLAEELPLAVDVSAGTGPDAIPHHNLSEAAAFSAVDGSTREP